MPFAAFSPRRINWFTCRRILVYKLSLSTFLHKSLPKSHCLRADSDPFSLEYAHTRGIHLTLKTKPTNTLTATKRGASTATKMNRLPSVLTSDVHNEAELIFSILQDPDHKVVSQLDVLTLLRGMGMNPVNADTDYLREVMAEPIERYEAMRREEEAKKEKERKREEAERKKKGGAFVAKPPPGKKGDPKSGTAGGAGGDGPAEVELEEGPDGKKRVKTGPREEVKNIDWNVFITAVEPIFRDNHQEQDEILNALKVFDEAGMGVLTRDELFRIVTSNGESVLGPAEIKLLTDMLPESMEFVEFAQRAQGTYVPPSAEEIAAKEEAERAAREERLRREREEREKADPMAALLAGAQQTQANALASPSETPAE